MLPMTMTFFLPRPAALPTTRATQGSRREVTWEDVLRQVENPHEWPPPDPDPADPDRADDDPPKKWVPGWTFTLWPGDSRRKGGPAPEAVHGLALDYDDDPDIDADVIRARWGLWRYAAHTTTSHNRPKHGVTSPRWRVLLPFAYPVPPEDLVEVGRWARHPRRGGGVLGAEAEHPWRFYFAPVAAPGGYEHDDNEGELLDPHECLAELAAWEAEAQTADDRENGPMADDTTTTEEEAPADLDRWTVAEAVRLLVARAHPERGRPVGFPWPGAPETWPLGGDGTTDIKPDAALPPADGVCRPNWRPLWSLVGPLSPDRVAVLVGPTGRGKTAFAVQVAEAAAAAGHPVVYLSVELGAEELAARLIALRARGAVPWRAVLRGQVPRPELEQAGTDLVTRCPNLYLCAPPPGQRTAARLARLARAVAARHDGRPPLVVVDYLQRMKGDESDRRWEVSALSGELRALSRPCDDFPGAGVLALSSTARTNYSGGKKSSLRGFWPLWRAASEDPDSLVGLGKETGEIEYDASLVLVLTCDPKMEDNDDDDDDDRGAEDKETTGREDTHRRGALAAAKVREGETGTVRLDFDGARGWWGDAKRLGRWKPKPPKDDTGEERTGRRAKAEKKPLEPKP